MAGSRSTTPGAASARRTPSRLAGWTGCLAFAAGALGALPNDAGPGSDPVSLLAWLALVTPAAGLACGAVELALWPWSAAVVGGWWMLLAGAAAGREDWPPQLLWAGLLIAGGFGAFHGVGRFLGARAARASGCREPLRARAARAASGASLLLLAGGLLSGLPGRGGADGRSWGQRSPVLGAGLFDSSPVTLVLETAGVDWARHPASYDPAGTEWFTDPAQRAPRSPALAAGVALVVGCASSLLARAATRTRA